MGCFGRLALFRSSRVVVVPDEVQPAERAAAAKQTAAAQLLGGDRRCASTAGPCLWGCRCLLICGLLKLITMLPQARSNR